MTFNELSEAVYEDLNGRVLSVSSDEKAYRVVFECDDWRDNDRRRRFELIFEDVPEANATSSECWGFHLVEEHPLLWNHNEENVSMFFSSTPSDPLALLGRLYEAHTLLVGEWREMSRYWKAGSKLLQLGYGLLAEGPRRIIDEYARVVGDTLRFSIVHGHNPRGGYRVVFFDECYVVCRNVSVIEHELPPKEL